MFKTPISYRSKARKENSKEKSYILTIERLYLILLSLESTKSFWYNHSLEVRYVWYRSNLQWICMQFYHFSRQEWGVGASNIFALYAPLLSYNHLPLLMFVISTANAYGEIPNLKNEIQRKILGILGEGNVNAGATRSSWSFPYYYIK